MGGVSQEDAIGVPLDRDTCLRNLESLKLHRTGLFEESTMSGNSLIAPSRVLLAATEAQCPRLGAISFECVSS